MFLAARMIHRLTYKLTKLQRTLQVLPLGLCLLSPCWSATLTRQSKINKCLETLSQIVELSRDVIPRDELEVWSRRVRDYLDHYPRGRGLSSFNHILTPEALPHLGWMAEVLSRRKLVVKNWDSGGHFAEHFRHYPRAAESIEALSDGIVSLLLSFSENRIPTYRETLRLAELWIAAMEMPFQDGAPEFLNATMMAHHKLDLSDKQPNQFLMQYLTTDRHSENPSWLLYNLQGPNLIEAQTNNLEDPLNAWWISRGHSGFEFFADLAIPIYTLGLVEELPQYDGIKPLDYRGRSPDEVRLMHITKEWYGPMSFQLETPYSDHVGEFWKHDFDHGQAIVNHDSFAAKSKNAKPHRRLEAHDEFLTQILSRVRFAVKRRLEFQKELPNIAKLRDKLHFLSTHELLNRGDNYRMPSWYLNQFSGSTTQPGGFLNEFRRRSRPSDLGTFSSYRDVLKAYKNERVFWERMRSDETTH